jgi:hypothetical protein
VAIGRIMSSDITVVKYNAEEFATLYNAYNRIWKEVISMNMSDMTYEMRIQHKNIVENMFELKNVLVKGINSINT